MQTLIIALLSFSTFAPLIPDDDRAAPPALDGTWGGWVEFADDSFWFQVRIDGDTLLIDDFNAERRGVPALEFQVDGAQLRFVYGARIGDIAFTGTVDERTLGGELSAVGMQAGRFEFTRFFDTPADRMDSHLGRYQTSTGKVLWVVPRTFGGLRIIEHTGDGTRFGDYWFDAWLPWKEDAYFEAVFDSPALPPRRSLVFVGDRMELRGDEGFVARRTSGAVRRLEFHSGSIPLHGWLMVPPGEGPHPAIAYAHGSGYVSADSLFDAYSASRMVRELGLAVMRWDKRGVWRSGGDQGRASYHDLADDIEAAAAWLRTQPDIDASKVGIGGLSQAPSWPVPLVAARADGIAFVVATSGSVTTIAETNAFHWTTKLRKEGHTQEHAQQAQACLEQLFPLSVDPSPAGQATYDAALARYADAPWFDRLVAMGGLDTPLDDPRLDRWRRIWNVDPLDSWRHVTCPVYQAWGADDHLVDAERCSARMQALLAETGQDNFTSIVYPSPAGHAVGSANTPTYFGDLARWFPEQVGSR
jgi:dienelactone hydrolase